MELTRLEPAFWVKTLGTSAGLTVAFVWECSDEPKLEPNELELFYDFRSELLPSARGQVPPALVRRPPVPVPWHAGLAVNLLGPLAIGILCLVFGSVDGSTSSQPPSGQLRRT